MATSEASLEAALQALEGAGSEAVDRLLPLVYAELKSLARRRLLAERPGHTLCPTALVHEAWLKLVGKDKVGVHGRAYFYAAAGRAMRQVLVDHARARGRDKRGGDAQAVTLVTAIAGAASDGVDVLALHDALEQLGSLDPRQAAVVEFRFFGGLTVEETATLLEVSPRTVKSDWSLARAWLFRELGDVSAATPP